MRGIGHSIERLVKSVVLFEVGRVAEVHVTAWVVTAAARLAGAATAAATAAAFVVLAHDNTDCHANGDEDSEPEKAANDLRLGVSEYWYP